MKFYVFCGENSRNTFEILMKYIWIIRESHSNLVDQPYKIYKHLCNFFKTHGLMRRQNLDIWMGRYLMCIECWVERKFLTALRHTDRTNFGHAHSYVQHFKVWLQT